MFKTKFKYTSQYGQVEDVEIHFYKEPKNNIGIRMTDAEGMPYMSISIPMKCLNPDEVAVKNYSENAGIMIDLLRHDILQKPHRYIESGFVLIPVCRFTDKAKEYIERSVK